MSLFVFLSASFFRSIRPAIQYISCTYWFLCGAAVSPAAFLFSRLQLFKRKEEEEEEKEEERRGGEMGRSREVRGKGRGQEIDCEKSQGFHFCWTWMIPVFPRLALDIYYIYIISTHCSGIFKSKKAGLYLCSNEGF